MGAIPCGCNSIFPLILDEVRRVADEENSGDSADSKSQSIKGIYHISIILHNVYQKYIVIDTQYLYTKA